jgi:hypothetical protein
MEASEELICAVLAAAQGCAAIFSRLRDWKWRSRETASSGSV